MQRLTNENRIRQEIESPSIYHSRNEVGADELFVAAGAARKLVIESQGHEQLSFYQHFASDSNPQAASLQSHSDAQES